MRSPSTTRIGVVAILLALVNLVFSAGFIAASLGRGWDPSLPGGAAFLPGYVSLPALILSLVLTAWLRTAIWRLCRGRRGDWLLLAALVCAVITALCLLLAVALAATSVRSGIGAVSFVLSWSMLGGSLFFAGGLVLSGIVPAWVAWTGVVESAVAIAGHFVYHGNPVYLVVNDVVIVLSSVFLIALGYSLVAKGVRVAPA